MILVIMAGLTGRQAHGAVAYLPAIGPAPLRFEQAPATGAVLTWKPLLLPAALPAETNKAPDTAKTPANTTNNGVAILTANAAPPAQATIQTNNSTASSLAAIKTGDNNKPEMAPAPALFPAAQTGALGPVTPQMLAEFFKPGPGGRDQNQTAVFVPAEINFQPPPPPPAESRAVYKVE